MITIRQFLGAVLEEITKARVIGDAASVRVAEQYLKHDFLKSYPVPRMRIRDIHLELNFAVGSKLHGVTIFEDEEARKNIRNQLRQFLEALPERPEIKSYFVQSPELAAKWKNALPGLDPRFEVAMVKKDADRVSVSRTLSLIIENSFFEMLPNQPGHGLLAMVTRLFTRQKPDAHLQPFHDYISDQIRNIILAVDTSDQEAQTLTDLLDLKVMVEASELEKVDISRMQKLKIVFESSDRKWVAGEKDGEKSYILDRH